MIPGKVNVVLDAQWGSSGKGKLCSFLARHFNATDFSVSNMPNAGHTVVDGPRKWVFKVLPSGAALQPGAIWICPGSVFSLERLHEELEQLPYHELNVHSRATVSKASDKEQEQAIRSVAAIASTGQGCSVAMTRKRAREADAVYGLRTGGLLPEEWQAEVFRRLDAGSQWLHEVSQGWALSLDWGTHY